jgi:hypothetical protein
MTKKAQLQKKVEKIYNDVVAKKKKSLSKKKANPKTKVSKKLAKKKFRK